MGTEPLYEKFREISWRRKLASAEEHELREWLAAHPEVQEQFELEASLTEALAKTADVPVASNFTARVLEAVQREAMGEAQGRGPRLALWGRIPRWLPRLASATLVLTVAGSVYLYNQNVEARQKDLVQRVAKMPLPSPEILTNFDAIRIVSDTPAPDEQLLALFK